VTDIPAPNIPPGSLAHLYRWDEIEGWRMLVQHFDLTEGFAFIVVLAPDDEAIALLRDQLPRLLPKPGAIERIRFDPAADPASLAESLLAASPSSAARVIWIDADPAPPEQFDEREKQWAAALGTLNRYRNTLTSKFATTLALALPTRLLPMLRRTAPDLWSIRSGLFRMEPPGASRAGMQRLPETEWRSLEDNDEGDAGDPAVTLAEADKLRGRPGREVLLATLLQRAGNQARRRLDWQTALASLQEAYTLQESAGADPELHWDIAIDLANVLNDVAKFDRAEFYLRRALQTAEQHFGASHPKTDITLNNLARLFQATNRLAEAEPLMRRSLAIDEQSFGDQHHKVATDMRELAWLLKATNRPVEAEPLMRRALAIDERFFGHNHPTVARDLSNLALLLKATNRLAEAEPLMRRALAIDEQSFGDQHPEVATDLSNLAILLNAANRMAEAEPLIRRALAIDEQSFGDDHPKVATRLNNLAWLLQSTKRFGEAEPLIRRALAINMQSFGDKHPRIAVCLGTLASLLQAANRLAEAEPLMWRALAIDEHSFGDQHPKVAIRLNTLASVLQATNRLAEAEPLMRRALAIDINFKRLTGYEHPNYEVHRDNYAALLKAMGRSQSDVDAALQHLMAE
jgi:tetratricopeptide (TPR) repeat protein